MRTAFALSLTGVLAASPVFGQPADVKGSKDHPLISRYAGSYIIGYDAREYGELSLALGPTRFKDKGFDFEYSKSQRVEGKLTRILYVAPEGRSSLEVLRNYENALKQAGFTTLFTCSVGECDDSGNPARFRNVIYSQDRQLENRGGVSSSAFVAPKDPRYLAAKLARPTGAVYVSLYVAVQGSDAVTKETLDRVVALLEIVETKPMEGGMVTVNAETMSRDINSTGHVALYGILFDTDSDVIKPESEPTLAEIAKLLKQTPQLRLHVVGHTDNVGGYDHNMTLSQRRADAVTKALVSRHGADARALHSVGVGPVAPVAPNDGEEGRTKNRRVELVKQ